MFFSDTWIVKQNLLYWFHADLTLFPSKQTLDSIPACLPALRTKRKRTMHSNLLAILPLLLYLPITALATPASTSSNAKRCMTEAQIEAIRAHWPKSAGHGPVMIPCDSKSSESEATNDASTMTLPSKEEVERLARRYLADERLVGEKGSRRKGCMTEVQVEAFQAAWPKEAGREPALVACGGGVEGGEIGVLE